jgi:hypothetical protein
MRRDLGNYQFARGTAATSRAERARASTDVRHKTWSRRTTGKNTGPPGLTCGAGSFSGIRRAAQQTAVYDHVGRRSKRDHAERRAGPRRDGIPGRPMRSRTWTRRGEAVPQSEPRIIEARIEVFSTSFNTTNYEEYVGALYYRRCSQQSGCCVPQAAPPLSADRAVLRSTDGRVNGGH